MGVDYKSKTRKDNAVRLIIVWCVALTLMFTVSVGYYITLPVAFALSAEIETQVSTIPAALQALRIVEYVVILWGPIWNFFILLWAYMESHRTDVVSQVYG